MMAPANDWNSALYLKFERERTRAARDLLAQVPDIDPGIVIDLGCGTGNSTLLLAQRFPRASIIGVDRSANMLAVARRNLPDIEFLEASIEDWRPPAPVDLIFANAALQFIPDHRTLIPRLVSHLGENGCLAFQMPNNIHELSHAIMRMVAADGPWSARLVPIAKSRAVIGGVEEYYRLLSAHCVRTEIWETTYYHALQGSAEIAAWFEGSALRPFLEALHDDEREAFLARYRSELARAYPTQPDGKALLRYPRLFATSRK